MLTDIEEIKRYMRAGYTLRNRGMGWSLEAPNHVRPPIWQLAQEIKVHDDLVALMTAQGHIETDLRLVGTAKWRQPEVFAVGASP